MVSFFRKLQLVFASVILIATSIAFVLEIMNMIQIRDINLPDLLLLFIYLEVIGMVTGYWRTQTIRLAYPLFIAITALARLIILQKKDIDPSTLVYEAGAILLPVNSVGVMGDERTYEKVVALRAVESTDGMTADWVHLPYDFLMKVSNDIINKVPGVNRVVYDISSKPPATIEWE